MFPAFWKLVLTGVILSSPPASFSADAPRAWLRLALNDGREYHGVKLMAVEPSGIKVMHSSGVARISYEQLPGEVAAWFPHDAVKAAEHRALLAAQERAARIRIAEEEAEARRQEHCLKRECSHGLGPSVAVPGDVALVIRSMLQACGCGHAGLWHLHARHSCAVPPDDRACARRHPCPSAASGCRSPDPDGALLETRPH